MSNVIVFPRAADKQPKEYIVKEEDVSGKMLMDNFTFTCNKCHHKTTFSSENMIFKVVEFFCKNCGSKYKVTNPGFSRS